MLGAGIGSFVNIFDAELVVIGGGFGAAAADYLFRAGARGRAARGAARLRRESASGSSRRELGSAAGLIGAGLIAFEALES